MLATFKFLDQTETIDTSNWKTYSNNLWGYQFSYPPDYSIVVSSQPMSTPDRENYVELQKKIETDIIKSLSLTALAASDIPSGFEFQSSQEFLKNNILGYCHGWVLRTILYCDKIVKQTSSTNKNGLKILELYLNEVQEGVYPDQPSIQKTRGPIYAIDISVSNSRIYRLLMIEDQENIFPKIKDTFKLTQ